MIQLSVKEAMGFLSDTSECIRCLTRALSFCCNNIESVQKQIQGQNEVQDILGSIHKKMDSLAHSVEESSSKLNEFASSQFDRYIKEGNRLEDKVQAIFLTARRLLNEIYYLDTLGDDFVELSYYENQKVGNAEVNFIKDSTGQSQKVVM